MSILWCGHTITLCLVAEEGTSDALVYWKHFSMEIIVTKKGEEKKKLKAHGQVYKLQGVYPVLEAQVTIFCAS
jgi:hypothetical protein